jgi:hypothetical protein
MVYSPRTVITTPPTVASVTYGETVASAPIGTDGVAEAVDSTDTVETQWEDISSKGSWSWKNPDTVISSLTGVQKAVLVFTPLPEYAVDWGDPDAGGFVAAEIEVVIDVEPATPTLSLEGSAEAIRFGQALSFSDLNLAGYEFEGAASVGHGTLLGTLSWKDADVVPGGTGSENSLDDQGARMSAKDDGVFWAKATFSPDATYGGAYQSVDVLVPVAVHASLQTAEALDDSVEVADVAETTLGLSAENYRADDILAFEAALGAAREAVVSGDYAESEVLRLSAELEAAIVALVHDHPVLTHSAPSGIKTHGIGVTVSFKGHFSSVNGVTVGGVALSMVAAPPLGYELWQGSVFAGTLSKGSAVVTLTPEYVDEFANGSHKIELSFVDDHASGQGIATLAIERPARTVTDGGDDDGGAAAGGGGSGAGAGGAAVGAAGAAGATAAGGLAAVDSASDSAGTGTGTQEALDSDTGEADVDETSDSGPQRLAAGGEDGASALLLAGIAVAALVLAAAIVAIFLARRRRNAD